MRPRPDPRLCAASGGRAYAGRAGRLADQEHDGGTHDAASSRDRGHEDPAALELLGRHLGEVLLAEHFLLRGAELDGVGARIGLCGVATARQRALHEPVGLQALVLLAHERCYRSAQEPRCKRPVEELQLVVPGDERLAEREVDVLLAREVDCVEAAECVEHTPGPDLDPRLAEHAAERDHVADDR